MWTRDTVAMGKEEQTNSKCVFDKEFRGFAGGLFIKCQVKIWVVNLKG